ncbi:uracil-DNA glycosylase [Patulibacter brassicae]|uniref:Uracil-DNA glycosylase n=1 Tax=Patulibacter brassicae TaxID=1705717 RepID=A0ABU4VLN5_9ACTN|nr:uracil-DNA glycosylase [Patulibacter brassicae]MDX8152737.1 uracil-DNA glycosylase [Patulibacter brassicae]
MTDGESGTTGAEPRSDGPRANRDPDELARKRSLLTEPHVAPLADYVTRLRGERGADRVPDFDPTEAGVEAKILLLLEAPGGKATVERGGSGFVSPDNNDGSAENMWRLFQELGVDRRREVVTWNVVPWYIGGDSKIRPAESSDLLEGQRYIEELVGLLPNLRVVVLIGKHAARGWQRLGIDLPTVEVPHPSPQNLNVRPHMRDQLRAGLQHAREIARVVSNGTV